MGTQIFGTSCLDRRNFGTKQHETVLLLASPKKDIGGYNVSRVNSIELSVGSGRICDVTRSK